MFKTKFLNKRSYKPSTPHSSRGVYSYSGGVSVNPESAMQVSAYHRGKIYIATTIAKLAWNVKDRNNEVLHNDRVNKLINLSPNPEMNAFMFKSFMVQAAIDYGNGYAEIERDMLGRPVALWPLLPHHISPHRDPDGTFYYRIVGGGPGNGDVYLLPKDVFHIRNFHTRDGMVGEGIVGYAKETLGIALGSDSFANSLFANGGLPSGVIQVEGTLKNEAIQRLKKGWNDAHGGRKVGGVAVLEQGTKYEPVSHDPQVLQFLESRKFTVQEIARFLGVPPQKLFDTSAQTFNNVENANLEVITDTIDAWTRNLELEADVKLLNNQRGGRRTEFDIRSVFRGDMKTRSDYNNKMMQSAALTPNEIRESEGLAPYDDGDRFYIANNNFAPVDKIDELLDSQIKGNEDSEKSKEQEQELTDRVQNTLRQLR